MMAKSFSNRTEKKEPLRAQLDCHGNRDPGASTRALVERPWPAAAEARPRADGRHPPWRRRSRTSPALRTGARRCLADQPHHGRRGLRRVAGARVAGQPRRQWHLGVPTVSRRSMPRAVRPRSRRWRPARCSACSISAATRTSSSSRWGHRCRSRSCPRTRFTLPDDEHAALLRDRGYYPFGLPALRQAIAAEFCRSGLPTDREQVLVTNGAQHAFMLCAMLYAAAWRHGAPRGSDLLRRHRRLPGHRRANRHGPGRPGGAAPAAIRGRMTAAGARLIYLTTTFQNPTGTVMPIQARKDLARMVSEFGVTVVDDRTMADLVLEGSPPPPACGLRSRPAHSDDRFVEQAGVAGTSCRLDSRAGTDGPAPGAVEECDGSRVTDHDAGRRGATDGHARRGARAATSAVEASTRPARVAAERAHCPTGRSGCRTAGCSCG